MHFGRSVKEWRRMGVCVLVFVMLSRCRRGGWIALLNVEATSGARSEDEESAIAFTDEDEGESEDEDASLLSLCV